MRYGTATAIGRLSKITVVVGVSVFMRAYILPASAFALALSGCGGKPDLALSGDAVTRAAQCGVVATTEARLAQTDVKAPVPFATQTRVLHYALLTAASGAGL